MARWGAGCGAALAALDILGAWIAIGRHFDPRPAGLLLLLISLLNGAAALGIVAGLAGLLWPPRLRLRLRWRPHTWAAVGLAVTVAVVAVSYATRVGRLAPELGPRPAVTASDPAPVLWVLIDTLRADVLYGPDLSFPLAPGLGAFARESLVFVDAESVAGWTAPSVSSLFTGLSSTALPTSSVLPDWAATVAERLRAAGYSTRAVVDNPLLEARNGFAAGFEEYWQKNSLGFAWTLPAFRLVQDEGRHQLRERLPVFYTGADRLTDRAIAVLEEDSEVPLFLYVHYMDPHFPYYPHEDSGPPPAGAEPVVRPWKKLRREPPALSDGHKTWLRHRYEQEVRFASEHVARLLRAWVERHGDRGLVLVTADHGEEMFEHGWLGHGITVYRELVHVPLILRLPATVLPAADQRRRIDTPVSLLDVLSTTLEALGVPPDLAAGSVEMHGRSWLPWLSGDAPAPERALVAHQDFRGRRLERLRAGGWAAVTTYESRKRSLLSRELFDKRSDYDELRDVAGEDAARLAEFVSAYDTWTRAHAVDTSGRPVTAEESEEMLRVLGYVE